MSRDSTAACNDQTIRNLGNYHPQGSRSQQLRPIPIDPHEPVVQESPTEAPPTAAALSFYFTRTFFTKERPTGSAVNFMHKDLGPFLESTAGLPISVPVSTLVRDLFSIGRRASRGSKDFIGGVESYEDFRTTLYYRLTRLRDIVGADPLNGAARLELHLAIKAERWSGAHESDPIIHWDQGISADRGNCGPPRGSTPPRETITV